MSATRPEKTRLTNSISPCVSSSETSLSSRAFRPIRAAEARAREAHRGAGEHDQRQQRERRARDLVVALGRDLDAGTHAERMATRRLRRPHARLFVTVPAVRIALVSREVYPYIGGGIAPIVTAAARSLSQIAEVLVLTSSGHREAARAAAPRRRPAAGPGERARRVRRGAGRRDLGRGPQLHALLQRAGVHAPARDLRRPRAGPDRVRRLPRRGLRHRPGAPHRGAVAARHARRGPPAHEHRDLRDPRRPRPRRLPDARRCSTASATRCATPTACCGPAATCSRPTGASTARSTWRPG